MTMVELLWTLKTGQLKLKLWLATPLAGPLTARPSCWARQVFVHMAPKLISTGFQLLFKMLLINWSTL